MAAATVLLMTSKAPGVDSTAIAAAAAAAAAASSSPPGKEEEEERVPEVVEDGPKS